MITEFFKFFFQNKCEKLSFLNDNLFQNLIQKELTNLKEEKQSLKTKMASNSLEFQEIAIFCQKTIQIQEDEIRRLEEIVEMEEKRHKEKILDFQQQNNENIGQLQKELERMKGEHLLMSELMKTLKTKLMIEKKIFQQRKSEANNKWNLK